MSEEDEEKVEENLIDGENRRIEYPDDDSKMTIFQWFKSIVDAEDNFKTGNLLEAELGSPSYPVRTGLELAHFCKSVGNTGFSNFFNGEAQITAGTSLSREGFLDNLAVTTKKEIAASARKGRISAKRNKWGLFTRKRPEEES